MVRFIKKDTQNRNHHVEEDLSFKLSPYKNRLPAIDSYKSSAGYKALSQIKPNMRNEGQKKTLQKVLDKLNMMNTRLNVEGPES